MRIATRRGALVAVVLAVLVVAGAAAAGRAWLQRPSDLPPVPATSEDVHAKAREVYERFMGTVDQRNASEVVRNELTNGEMDRCLDRAGFPEWGDTFPRSWAVPHDPLDAGRWLAEPNRPFLSEGLMAQRRGFDTEIHANRDDIGDEENAAIDDCLASTPGASEGPVERQASPQLRWRLYDAWEAAITAYATDGHDVADYVECMADVDVPGLDPTYLYQEGLESATEGLRPSLAAVPSASEDPLAHEPAWERFLATERTITDADWRCRADVYVARIDGALAVIEQFEAEHADELAATQAEWEAVEVWAAELS